MGEGSGEMRYEFQVRRLVVLPIRDYSELEMMLDELEVKGRRLVTTFDSYDSFEDDYGARQEGLYLFGIFRKQHRGAAR